MSIFVYMIIVGVVFYGLGVLGEWWVLRKQKGDS